MGRANSMKAVAAATSEGDRNRLGSSTEQGAWIISRVRFAEPF